MEMKAQRLYVYVSLKKKEVRFALERNKRMKNDYAIISNHDGICIVEQTRENGIW